MSKHAKEMQQITTPDMTEEETLRAIERRLDGHADAESQPNGNEPNESTTLAEQVERLRNQLRAMAEAYQGTTQFLGLQRQVSRLENRTAELERVRRGEVEQRRDLTRRVKAIERRLSRTSTGQ
jgi:hypothetical protein